LYEGEGGVLAKHSYPNDTVVKVGEAIGIVVEDKDHYMEYVDSLRLQEMEKQLTEDVEDEAREHKKPNSNKMIMMKAIKNMIHSGDIDDKSSKLFCSNNKLYLNIIN
jgi:hypothetical protein